MNVFLGKKEINKSFKVSAEVDVEINKRIKELNMKFTEYMLTLLSADLNNKNE